MTFMQLVGVNSINVTVTAQTKKTTGLEVAVVLDNTGSMLCGPNDGAPSYTDAQCGGSVVASDTTCTDPSNQSRICTLINAATQFVNTLTSAITATQQLYISVVPYVTTVNVGNSFCTGATSCSHIATDCSGDFSDDSGNAIGVSSPITITGNTSAASNRNIITNISPNTTGLTVGTSITGSGIPNGTTVTSVELLDTNSHFKQCYCYGSGTSITVNLTGNITNGSNIITNFHPNPNSFLTVGSVIMAQNSTGTAVNASVQSIDSATQIHICNNATATTSSFVLPRGTAVTYDTAHSGTTQNWMGCVIEPTSSGENSGVAGVINSPTANPDTTEPGSWPNWYPYWWPNGSGNSWPPVSTQSNTTRNPGQRHNRLGRLPRSQPRLPGTDTAAH